MSGPDPKPVRRIVTIDDDDPPMFHTSISREYGLVEQAAGAEMLERFVYNAIAASFAPKSAKASMRERVAEACAEPEASRRT